MLHNEQAQHMLNYMAIPAGFYKSKPHNMALGLKGLVGVAWGVCMRAKRQINIT
ncbi:hypothetical protein HBZC1_00820 [Helicobacter bizzozeronii CIII-1]|uniref:Uncharacterized protein n=1 Tax=Helicobacter bizzozeronii (strain CIII-1) TaxID=1002804 RepID=F8KQR4_HELBC|nr:hypothetical protein HBZC1_00820 [Helicobacter bizzozeronii CIII-1]